MSSYPPPVDALLTKGVADFSDDWPDYVAEHGLGRSMSPT